MTESTEATQLGADVSIEDRLLERLDPTPDDAPPSEDAPTGENQDEPEATAEETADDAPTKWSLTPQNLPACLDSTNLRYPSAMMEI